MEIPARDPVSEYPYTLEEVIKQVELSGVNLGESPRKRVNSLISAGLMPLPDNGRYPAWTVQRIIAIENKLIEGKSLEEIRRQVKNERKRFLSQVTDLDSMSRLYKKFSNNALFAVLSYALVAMVAFGFLAVTLAPENPVVVAGQNTVRAALDAGKNITKKAASPVGRTLVTIIKTSKPEDTESVDPLGLTNLEVETPIIPENLVQLDGFGDLVLTGLVNALGFLGSGEGLANLSWTSFASRPKVLSAIDGVENDGSNVDLVAGSGINISPNDEENTIIISSLLDFSSQFIFKNIAVSGQSNIVADLNNDTLTFVAGSNVSLTTDATTDSLTIGVTGTVSNADTLDLLDSTDFLRVAGGTMGGNINFNNNLAINIGAAGTDFTSGGGLNIATALDVTGHSAFGSGASTLSYSVLNIDESSTNTSITGGLFDVAYTGGGASAIPTGLLVSSTFAGSAVGTSVIGLDVNAIQGSATVSAGNVIGIRTQAGSLDPSANFTNSYGLWVEDIGIPLIGFPGFPTNSYGIRIGNQGTSATNTYAIYIDNQVGSTNNYSIYQTGTSGDNILNADTRIGSTTAPAYDLDVTGIINASSSLRTGGSVRVDAFGALWNITDIDASGDVTIDGDVTIGDGLTGGDYLTITSSGVASVISQTRDSDRILLQGAYWDGGSSQTAEMMIMNNVLNTTPEHSISFLVSPGVEVARFESDGDAQIYGTLTLTSGGNLTVAGGQISTAATQLILQATGANADVVVQGGLCIRDATACNDVAAGGLEVDTAGGSADDPGDVFDVAEIYTSIHSVLQGEVVSAAGNGNVRKSSGKYDGDVLGVASSHPAALIEEGTFSIGVDKAKYNPTKPWVALAGRVPTKVSTENGDISAGDPLTSSSMPGVAMKATESGPIIGKALEAYSGPPAGGSIGKIMVFVSTGWYVAPLAGSDDLATSLALITDLDVETLIATTVKAEKIFTDELVVSGETSGSGQVKSGQKSVIVENSRVKSSSKILVTFTSDYSPANRFWVSKKERESFTVHLDQPVSKESPFDWLIVN